MATQDDASHHHGPTNPSVQNQSSMLQHQLKIGENPSLLQWDALWRTCLMMGYVDHLPLSHHYYLSCFFSSFSFPFFSFVLHLHRRTRSNQMLVLHLGWNKIIKCLERGVKNEKWKNEKIMFFKKKNQVVNGADQHINHNNITNEKESILSQLTVNKKKHDVPFFTPQCIIVADSKM